MLNQVVLIGRTTRDVELRTTSSGRPFGILTIAVQRSFKNQQTKTYDTDFIDVTLWGSTAENVAKYAGKGSAVSVRGRVSHRIIDNPNEPTIRVVSIVGDQVSFIHTKAPGMLVNGDGGNNDAEPENAIDGVTMGELPQNDSFDEEIKLAEEEMAAKQEMAS